MRPGTVVVGALLVLGLLGLAAFYGRRYRANFEVFAYELVPRPVEQTAAEGRRLGLSVVEVGGLRALLRPPASGHAWLMYWGGNAATYFKDAIDTVEGFRLPPDIGVLILAPPGYDSPGHPSRDGLTRDAVMARDWLRDTQGAERIVVGGFSLGTFSAVAAAAQHVSGALLLGVSTVMEANDPGPLIRLREPVRYRYPRERLKVPTLVLKGELDEPEDGAIVTDWLGARMVLVPGAKHRDTPTHPAALREGGAFIEALLLAR